MTIEMDSREEAVVADAIIRKMRENGKWEALRVELASTLRVNNDFKRAEKRAQQILATEQLKKMMKLPSTTVEDVARKVERTDAMQEYASTLADMLKPSSQMGADLQREVAVMVDDYIHEAP